uniref:Uncharacterized protein n=1 Tax=Sphaerodactylus townsendi TaxID=933632 RepID=A0ACB8G427_9SAUR
MASAELFDYETSPGFESGPREVLTIGTRKLLYQKTKDVLHDDLCSHKTNRNIVLWFETIQVDPAKVDLEAPPVHERTYTMKEIISMKENEESQFCFWSSSFNI